MEIISFSADRSPGHLIGAPTLFLAVLVLFHISTVLTLFPQELWGRMWQKAPYEPEFCRVALGESTGSAFWHPWNRLAKVPSPERFCIPQPSEQFGNVFRYTWLSQFCTGCY